MHPTIGLSAYRRKRKARRLTVNVDRLVSVHTSVLELQNVLHNQINEYLHDVDETLAMSSQSSLCALYIYILSHDCGKFVAPVIGERERKFELSGLNFDIAVLAVI